MTARFRLRQAWVIARLELKRVFLSRRSLWVYALALLPAALFIIHAIDVEYRMRQMRQGRAVNPAVLDAIEAGMTEQRVLELAALLAIARMGELAGPAAPAGGPALTTRERDCLCFVADGLSDGEIADRLGAMQRDDAAFGAPADRARQMQQAGRPATAGQDEFLQRRQIGIGLLRPGFELRHAPGREAFAARKTQFAAEIEQVVLDGREPSAHDRRQFLGEYDAEQ